MKLHQLIKTNKKSGKRLGRGLGSGKGKTGGRGTKGQKARGKIPASFIGGTLPLYKKLPLKKGKGNKKVTQKSQVIQLGDLRVFKSKDTVDFESLIANRLITNKMGVKILGGGDINKALIIKVAVSASARAKIEKAGGKIE